MIPFSAPTPFDVSRPLQFVSSFEQWCGTTEDTMRPCFQALLDAGVSGLVTTVSLQKYLEDDKAWEVLACGVKLAHSMGLRVWIYDEKGYPSGTAGGLVLAGMPEGEAEGLIRAFDTSGKPHYEVRKLFEGTHATANFSERRHYINILDRDAVKRFIEVTHERYERALHPISDYVEAFFTDEPSLISTYVPSGLDYPRTLPWHEDLPKIFHERKGYDLTQHWENLFIDTGEEDRKIRCDFYEVIADLCADTYFGQLQTWCQSHGVSSSGHLLGEETLVWQTDFDGDPFTCYRRFDIPGIDMILSNPERILKEFREGFFMVPKVAGSAARLSGKRRVMCEISDFFGLMGGRHATLEQVKCTAAVLMSLGVTDFVSMYTISLHPGEPADPDPKARRFSAAEFRQYTDFVSRVNKVFSEGKCRPRVAVLHPIVSLWANFTPSERSMYELHSSERVRSIDDGFTGLCRALLQHQVEFDIVDERSLVRSQVRDGRLVIGDFVYETLVLPPMDTIRLQTMEKIAQFVDQKGAVFASPLHPQYAAEGPDKDRDIQSLVKKMLAKGGLGGLEEGAAPLHYLVKSRILPTCTLVPSSSDILCTSISTQKGQTHFLVNASSREYSGQCAFRSLGAPVAIDPASGKKWNLSGKKIDNASFQVQLTLRPFESVFVSFA